MADLESCGGECTSAMRQPKDLSQSATHRPHKGGLLHSLKGVANSVVEADAGLAELLGCRCEPRVLFDARRQLLQWTRVSERCGRATLPGRLTLARS